MKTTRKNFTSGLKYCKRNKQKIKDTIVAEIFRDKNVSKFFKRSPRSNEIEKEVF